MLIGYIELLGIWACPSLCLEGFCCEAVEMGSCEGSGLKVVLWVVVGG